MVSDEQPELDLATEPVTFYTDERLCTELAQIENGLADFETRVPIMRRRIASLREQLTPKG